MGACSPTAWTVSAKASVLVDEYHHGVNVSDLAPQAWVLTPWARHCSGCSSRVRRLLLRGRSFGPLIPGRPRARASTRSGRRGRSAAATVQRSRRHARSSRHRDRALPGSPDRDSAASRGSASGMLSGCACPRSAADLAEAENALMASASTEAELLKSAQRLQSHRSSCPARKGPTRPCPSAGPTSPHGGEARRPAS